MKVILLDVFSPTTHDKKICPVQKNLKISHLMNFLFLLQAFMKGDTQIMADEAFQNAVANYYEVFLKSDRLATMVSSGACSQHDFREVFRLMCEKRVR